MTDGKATKEKAPKITERKVVDYIIENWDKFFPDIQYLWKEHSFTENWRCDIVGCIPMQLGEEYGFPNDDPYNYKALICFEAKYNSASRDLIYELEKAVKFLSKSKYPNYVCVLLDDYNDEGIYDYLVANNINMYKYTFKDDDLSTMKVEVFNPKGHLIVDKA
jgi:hypothetical protein